jgi:hypothetical protein
VSMALTMVDVVVRSTILGSWLVHVMYKYERCQATASLPRGVHRLPSSSKLVPFFVGEGRQCDWPNLGAVVQCLELNIPISHRYFHPLLGMAMESP